MEAQEGGSADYSPTICLGLGVGVNHILQRGIFYVSSQRAKSNSKEDVYIG